MIFCAELDMQLLGEHQRENAVTAIGAALALRRQGFHRLNLKSITAGLRSATLPGRFQVCFLAPALCSSPPPSPLPRAANTMRASGPCLVQGAFVPSAVGSRHR